MAITSLKIHNSACWLNLLLGAEWQYRKSIHGNNDLLTESKDEMSHKLNILYYDIMIIPTSKYRHRCNFDKFSTDISNLSWNCYKIKKHFIMTDM